MAHSPAFQFYYKDFRQDPKTINMNTTEIGAYMLLLIECWDQDNTLPMDIRFLAMIARCPIKQFEKMWAEKIEHCFVFDRRKKVYSHKRLAKEIEKQKAWSKTKSEAGKRGADKRWKDNNLQNGTAIAQLPSAIAEHGSSSSSSSSFKTKDTVELSVFLGKMLAGVMKELGLKTERGMGARKEWIEFGTIAFENGFPVEQFLECFSLLRKQTWRNTPPKPKHVMEHLPELDRLRKEIGVKSTSYTAVRNQPTQREAIAAEQAAIAAMMVSEVAQ